MSARATYYGPIILCYGRGQDLLALADTTIELNELEPCRS
jgi:hypothetical protein